MSSGSRRPPVLLLLAAVASLAACAVSPPRDPGDEELVPRDAPIFDPRLRNLDPRDLDLGHFWHALPPDAPPAPVPLHSHSFARVAARARPGVVNIYTRRVERRDLLLGLHPNDLLPIRIPVVSALLDVIPFQVPVPFRGEGTSLGSGFVLNGGGYVLTNAHVVQNATDIRLVLGTGEAEARIIGIDPLTDTALLHFEPEGPLHPLPLGDSDAVEIGELVLALGNPLGLQHTVTSGIVSAKERLVPGEEGRLLDYLQTDSAINPGSSGGPLLNLRGEVVGINTALVTEAQLIGFAIPINTVKAVMRLLILGPERRGWLGISTELPREADGGPGVEVAEVLPGSPAEGAGIRAGDRITAVDGQPVASLLALRRISLGFLAGEELALELEREGRPLRVTAVLAPLPHR